MHTDLPRESSSDWDEISNITLVKNLNVVIKTVDLYVVICNFKPRFGEVAVLADIVLPIDIS